VIAGILWIYVTVYINPEGEITITDIPVEFINDRVLEGRGLMRIGRDEPLTVSVRFAGRLRDYVNINHNSVRAVIDLSNVRTDGLLPMAYELEGPPELSFLNYYKSDPIVNVTIDRVISKDVRLRADIGTFETGFENEPASFWDPLDPSYELTAINITGPSSVLDTVYEAVVTYEPHDPINKTVNLSLDYTLLTQSGEIVEKNYITADINDILLHIPVIMTRTVPLKPIFTDGGGLTESDIEEYTFYPVNVRIAGDPEDLKEVNSIPVAIVLALWQDAGTTAETRVISYPEGVVNIDNINEAEVTLTVNDNIITRDITFSNVSLVNPPEGFSFELVTPITVTFRGPRASVNRMTPLNAVIEVDLSTADATAGSRLTSSVRVSVHGIDGVGAVNKGYEVVFDVSVNAP
jgi:YbbR domain-containing protein